MTCVFATPLPTLKHLDCLVPSSCPPFLINLINLYVYVHVCICMQLYARACVWRSEDSLRESVLSLSHMDPRNGTQVFGLGSKYFYLLSHLAGPSLFVYPLDNLYCLTDFTSTRGGLALCGGWPLFWLGGVFHTPPPTPSLDFPGEWPWSRCLAIAC